MFYVLISDSRLQPGSAEADNIAGKGIPFMCSVFLKRVNPGLGILHMTAETRSLSRHAPTPETNLLPVENCMRAIVTLFPYRVAAKILTLLLLLLSSGLL